ncbi:MAG: tetratricopeptide repeat protein [Rubripirellula sp.]
MPSSFSRSAMMAVVTLVVMCGCSSEAVVDETRQNNDAIRETSEIAPTDSGTEINATEPDRRSRLAVQDAEIGASAVESMEQNPTASEVDRLQEDTITALDSGDLDTAFELVRELQRVDGENPQTIFLMARVLAEKHRFRQAVKMLDDLAVEFPETHLAVLGQTAEWLVFQGDWQSAEERYRTLSSLVDDTSLVDRLLSRLLMRQGRRVEASKLLKRLCRVGNVEEMDLRSLLSLSCALPGDAATDAFEPIGLEGTARHAISMRQLGMAAEMLQQAASDSSIVLGPAEYALQGRVLALLEEFEQLTKWINSAPAGVRQYPDYWFALGAHQLQQADFSTAAESLGRAVLRDQTDYQAYRILGEALKQLGKAEQAKMAIDRADLIEKTISLGNDMASNAQRDVRKISVLIELLEQLQRPMEALGWRGIQVAYGRANAMLDDAAARNVLQMINQKRLDQLGETENKAKRLFVTCGLEIPPDVK